MKNKSHILQEIISNDELLQKIWEANNNDEIKQIFQSKGISLTNEQIIDLKNNFKDQFLKTNLIGPKNLENILGGKNYVNTAFKGKKGGWFIRSLDWIRIWCTCRKKYP